MDSYEQGIVKLMGMPFEQFCEAVKAGMTQGSSKDYLCYGKHGEIKFSVFRVGKDLPKYCLNSKTLKHCKECAGCKN